MGSSINNFIASISSKKQFLKLKFDKKNEAEKPICIRVKDRVKLHNPVRPLPERFSSYPGGKEIANWYSSVKWMKLFMTSRFIHFSGSPLIHFLPIESVEKQTSYYQTGGKYDWKIDLNKSKKIYRTDDQWVVFALVDKGSACLTVFLTGSNAGSIFYLTSEPKFNILKPIAKDLNTLLDRIRMDPVRFLQLVEATVSIRGKDGFDYGFVPVEVVSDEK